MLIEAISTQVFRKAAPLAIRHLARPDLDTSEPLSRRVLDQAAREFQMVPPITIHSADPQLMAGLWCLTREASVVGAKGRAAREAVAAAVSRLNACPYCVTVHSACSPLRVVRQVRSTSRRGCRTRSSLSSRGRTHRSPPARANCGSHGSRQQIFPRCSALRSFITTSTGW
jgi:alkylhydroperoxidase family enzyme